MQYRQLGVVSVANIIPTIARLDKYAIIEDNIIEDVMSLRPKPEKDVLLIVGDAACVFDDLKRFYALGVEHDTMLINHSIHIWEQMNEPFEHFIAGDSHRDLERQLAKRCPPEALKHCWNPGCGEENGFDIRWVKQDRRGWSGTTATLGIKIAISLDYIRMVMAGCPMDSSGHWYDKHLKEEDFKRKSVHSHHLWFWTELATRPLGTFIRSMSGNTRDLFGEPTQKWLTEVIGHG